MSRCLLGEPVRYDGTSKFSPELLNLAADSFELVPICPEVEAGLGVPRPPIQLVKQGVLLQLRACRQGEDLTHLFQPLVSRFESILFGAHGLVLKSRSPSCGVRDTPRFDMFDRPLPPGPGWLLASLGLAADFPVVDELDLLDAGKTQDFVKQVRSYWCLKQQD